MKRVLFAAILSPRGDTRPRHLHARRQRHGPATLFDVPGVPLGSGVVAGRARDRVRERRRCRRRQSRGRHGDLDDGRRRHAGAADAQRDARRGPGLAPDGTLLAYTSGPDDPHGDIHVMTAAGGHLRTLTSFAGPDESPDWQAIPAPRDRPALRRARPRGAGVRDVRAMGRGLRLPGGAGARAAMGRAGGAARVAGFRVDTPTSAACGASCCAAATACQAPARRVPAPRPVVEPGKSRGPSRKIGSRRWRERAHCPRSLQLSGKRSHASARVACSRRGGRQRLHVARQRHLGRELSPTAARRGTVAVEQRRRR